VIVDGVVVGSVLGVVGWWVAGAVVAVGTTLLAARFLGVGRGWLQALITGAVGWVGALLVAAGLADWSVSPNLFWEAALIAVPLTMVLMVGTDLVARPGSLARGDDAGLVTAPHPIAGLRSRAAPFARYRELVGIMRRHQLGHLRGEPVEVDDELLAPPEVRLREALEEAGGVFVKLGQIAATRIDLLPPQLCAELSRLQSRSTPVPADDVRTVLEEEYGRPAGEVFASFEWEPLAAASIGQTHTAVLHTGEAVVVKIQRPGIRDTIERDLGALDQLAALAERRTVLGRDLQVAGLAREFGRSLRSELDFRREARSTAEMHAVVGDDPLIRVPEVYPELCTRRVMVQERLIGVPLSDLPSDARVDREELAQAFLRTNIDNILHEGLFHADPHPGNVLVLDDGRLGMIDFGATGRLDAIQQQAVIDMLIALVGRDVSLLRDGIERVADVGSHVSRDRFERALARLLAEHSRPGGVVDPQALSDLVPLLASFQITLPGDLVVLLRALITLDGTLGVLSPGFGVVQAGMDLARQQATERGDDPEEVLEQALLAELPVLRRLPADLGRTLALLSRGTLQFRTVTAEDDDRFLRTLVNRGLLAAIGAALALTSALLLGLDLGPRLGDGPLLVHALGAGGIALGAVLMLRVVASVVRDGTR
jgi:ubiquinone biosynthesis protein